ATLVVFGEVVPFRNVAEQHFVGTAGKVVKPIPAVQTCFGVYACLLGFSVRNEYFFLFIQTVKCNRDSINTRFDWILGSVTVIVIPHIVTQSAHWHESEIIGVVVFTP